MKTKFLPFKTALKILAVSATLFSSAGGGAQCTITAGNTVLASTYDNAALTACGGVITVNGILRIDNNDVDWEAIYGGPISIVVDGPTAELEFFGVGNTARFYLPAGSTILLLNGGLITDDSPCAASERLYVGGTLVATCNGAAGALYSFADLNAMGGFFFTHIWTGASSTNWGTNGNWNPPLVPGVSDDAVIPAGPANQPAVNGAFTISELHVNSGASLYIGNGSSLTVNDEVENNGFIDVDNTGALVIYGSLTGNGISETRRAFPTNDRFHFFGSSVTGTTANATGINTATVNGSGQLVSEAACNPLQLAAGSPWSRLLRLEAGASSANNCSQELWFTVGAGEILTPGRGYAGISEGNTLFFTGTFNSENLTTAPTPVVGGTIVDPILPGTINRGWYLLSNPYPCPVTITAADLTSRGFDAQVQVWAGISGIWVPSALPVTLDKNQGFQIRKNATTTPDAFTFYKANKASTPSFGFQNFNFEKFLSINLERDNFNMNTVIFFDETATDGFDSHLEANRLAGDYNVPLIYTKAGENEHMAYNAYAPLFNESKTVVMGVYDGATPGNFSLRFQDLITLENTTVTLEDTKLNTFTPVEEGFVYNFTTEAGDDQERFRIHFSMLDVSGIAGNTENAFALFPNPTTDAVVIKFTQNVVGGNVFVRDLSGKTLFSANVPAGTDQIQLDVNHLASGMYVVELRTQNGERTVQKLIKK